MHHCAKKLTPASRLLLVTRIRAGGHSPVEVARQLGVSRATVYFWLKRYDQEGEAGLYDRRPVARRCRHKLTAAQEGDVLALRKTTGWGPHRLAHQLGMPRSTVYGVLRRHGCSRLADCDRVTREVVRYVRDRPGELLHVDIKKQARIPTGGGWRTHGRGPGHGSTRGGYDHIHCAVDDCSRVAYVENLHDEQAATAVAFLRRATDWFASIGVTVERVMTDNGSCYRSRAWRDCCTEPALTPKFTRVRRPQTNGKVERFNRTIATECFYAHDWTSNDERVAGMGDWLHWYNCHRPHTALGMRTPAEVVSQGGGNYN